MKVLIGHAELAKLFDAGASARARAWLADATARVAEQSERIDALYAGAARGCGREPLSDLWRTDMAARVLLLTGPRSRGPEPMLRLYRHGTTDERLAVLLALDIAEDADASLVALNQEALRSNDTRLIAAALGTFAARWLGAEEFRQAVLKCAFCGVPFRQIAGLPDPKDAEQGESEYGESEHCESDRADAALAGMLATFARERVAAGRDVPDDVWPVLRRFPGAVAESGLLAEPSAPDPLRAAAARRALDSYHRPEGR